MAEPLRHDLERLAGGQRRGRVAVANTVQGDRRQAGVSHQPGKPLGDVLRVEDLPVLAGEDQARVSPRRPPGEPLLELPDPVPFEHGGGERVEGELPASTGLLGLGDDDWAPVDDHHGLDDSEPAGRGVRSSCVGWPHRKPSARPRA